MIIDKFFIELKFRSIRKYKKENIERSVEVLISIIPNNYKYNPVSIDMTHWKLEVDIERRLYDQQLINGLNKQLKNLYNNNIIKSCKFGLMNESN